MPSIDSPGRRIEAGAVNAELTRAARRAGGEHPLDLARRSGYSAERSVMPISSDTATIGVPDLNALVPITPYTGLNYRPELHCLDAEWYYTAATAAALARRLGDGKILLLGTPTVAGHLSLGATLIDRSPYLRERFPALAGVRVESVDLDDPNSRLEIRADAVLLDPPWYEPSMSRWIGHALRAVVPGGRVLMPLIGPRTRPGAAAERDEVVRALASIGQVTIEVDAVEYDVPLFEERALAAAGIVLSQPWRRADLLEVRCAGPLPENVTAARVSSPASDDAPTPTASGWEAFRFEDQIIRLRRAGLHRSTAAAHHLRRITEPGWVLDSVSRRDPRLRSVDLWTSRQSVAAIAGNSRDIRAALADVERWGRDWLVAGGPHQQLRIQLCQLLEVGNA